MHHLGGGGAARRGWTPRRAGGRSGCAGTRATAGSKCVGDDADGGVRVGDAERVTRRDRGRRPGGVRRPRAGGGRLSPGSVRSDGRVLMRGGRGLRSGRLVRPIRLARFPIIPTDLVGYHRLNVSVQLSVSPDVQPGYRGLAAFCDLIGEPLQPHEKRIARAYFGPAREIAPILPRGNAKTTLAAKIGVHHLLTQSAAPTSSSAPRSVPQARICFERMRGLRAAPRARRTCSSSATSSCATRRRRRAPARRPLRRPARARPLRARSTSAMRCGRGAQAASCSKRCRPA